MSLKNIDTLPDLYKMRITVSKKVLNYKIWYSFSFQIDQWLIVYEDYYMLNNNVQRPFFAKNENFQ